jgi:alkylation response protein AidB-like acyl-CoA dehydrogenase
LAEEALLFREIGRGLGPGPFLATCLGARVAAGAGSAELCASILRGGTVVGLAELPVGVNLADPLTTDVDLYDAVDVDLVLAVTPAAAALFEARALRSVESVECIDPSTRTGTARLDEARAVAAVTVDSDLVFLRGVVLSAAMLSGVAEAVRDMAAEHARSRIQFGKPIGVHQAVKHSCTNMALRAEAATCQTFLAAMTVEKGLPDAAFQASSAKIVATEAALHSARDNIQLHGGMGFTWEHDAHLMLKRAHVLSQIFGDRHQHLAQLIALPAAQ